LLGLLESSWLLLDWCLLLHLGLLLKLARLLLSSILWELLLRNWRLLRGRLLQLLLLGIRSILRL
jgi:hypothetical protein